MISLDDILTSSDKYEDRKESPECTHDVMRNAAILAGRVTQLLALLGVNPKVSSGFRTVAANHAAGGAPHSNHLTGCAVDLEDIDNSLDNLIDIKPSVLAQCDLYREAPSHTHGWVHLQIVAPGSGDRTFIP